MDTYLKFSLRVLRIIAICGSVMDTYLKFSGLQASTQDVSVKLLVIYAVLVTVRSAHAQ